MTFTTLGKKIAFISAAALIVAACSKEPTPDTTVTAPVETAETGGKPDQPVTPSVSSDELTWGGANQSGIAAYSGADRVFFDYDSSELTSTARATLQKQYEWLMHYPRVKVTIEGHCDERGTREYNLALGERRAAAVKNYLIALGVPSSRMTTISYGKERPAVVGDYAQNRRGVLVVN